MIAFQSRHIRELLGADAATASYAHYTTLTSGKVPEAFDPDYKAWLYGTSDPARRGLAGDVTALASAAGALLICGIAEDGQARATAPGVWVDCGRPRFTARGTGVRSSVAAQVEGPHER